MLAARPNLDLAQVLERVNTVREDLGSVSEDEREDLSRAHEGENDSLDLVYALMTSTEREVIQLLGAIENPRVTPWMLAALIDKPDSTALKILESLVFAGLFRRADSHGVHNQVYEATDFVVSYANKRLGPVLGSAKKARAFERLQQRESERKKHLQPFKATRSQVFSMYQRGEFVKALDAASEALAAARENDDRRSQALCLVAVAEIHAELGSVDDARDYLREAKQHSYPESMARAGRVEGKLLRRLRQLYRANDVLDESLRLARLAEDVAEEIRVLRELVVVHGLARRTSTGLAHLERAQRLASGGRFASEEPGLKWAHGQLLAADRRFSDAYAHMEQAFQLTQPHQRLWRSWISHGLGTTALASGMPDRAMEHLATSLHEFVSIRHRYGASHCRLDMGRALLSSGGDGPERLKATRALLEDAADTFRSSGDSWIEGEALVALAEAHARMSNQAAADLCLALASEAYKRAGHAKEARLARQRASLYRRLGDKNAEHGADREWLPPRLIEANWRPVK